MRGIALENIKQDQKGGKESTNIQVGTVNNYQGLGYSDVKCICKDLFEENFIRLKNEAEETAKSRIEEFIQKLIDELIKNKVENLIELRNPDMQYVLYEAEKGYVRCGDRELLDILVNILVDRTKETEESLIRLNFNESLNIISKLTSEQRDILTLSLIIRYSKDNNVINEQTLVDYLRRYIVPFSNIDIPKTSSLKYMSYLGCGNILIGKKLEEILIRRYKDILPENNLKEYIIGLVPEMDKVFDIWNNSELYCLDLTSVGMVIGNANMTFRIGVKHDLSIWI